MEFILEYYIYDYTIFEATLKRDFLELLSEEESNNNSGYKEYKYTDAHMENDLWRMAYVLIDALKEKIDGMIDSILKFTDEKEINHWEKKIKDNINLIDKTDFSEFKIEGLRCPDMNELGKLYTKLYGSISQFSIVRSDVQYNDKANDELKEQIKSSKGMRKVDHDNIWMNPLKDFQKICNAGYLLDGLKTCKKNYREAQKLKRSIKRHHINLKREADAMKRLAKEKKDKEEKKQELKLVRNIVKNINLHKSICLNLVKTIIIEQKNIFNWTKKIASAVINYAKKANKDNNMPFTGTNESHVDMDYIIAIAEAEVYESEL